MGHGLQLAAITLLWLAGLNTGWDWLSLNRLLAHVTKRNFHNFYKGHWQPPCTALIMAGKCLPLGLCKETVKESIPFSSFTYWIILRKQKNMFAFAIISQYGNGTGRWNPSWWTCSMIGDDLVMEGVKALLASNSFSWNIPPSALEWLMQSNVSQIPTIDTS